MSLVQGDIKDGIVKLMHSGPDYFHARPMYAAFAWLAC